LALASLVRARERVKTPVEIVYLNDGPIPADRLTLMERTGEVLARERLGNKRSLGTAYKLPVERNWPDGDLVWFAEDDHLYRADALTGLVASSSTWPEADYFALYASFGARGSASPLEQDATQDLTWIPNDWRDSEPRAVNRHPWRRALSYTCSFGGRASAIKRDQLALKVGLYGGGAFDVTTCLLLAGFTPYSLPLLIEPLRTPTSFKRRLRGIAVAGVRAGVDAFQIARRGPHRLLIAPEPALATHLEADHLAIGTDWTEIAREVTRWMRAGAGLNDSASTS
ncbi:MAG TPA: hypothetical protein VHZ95_13110, partial [Polyangiales bacterium]|nr:hypothetical protein [Polyangiales bacterium]